VASERDEDYVKVRFRLIPRRDGWPPGETEGLWAEIVPGGYRIANTPFFADGCALNDVVSATPDRDGVLWFDEVVRESGYCSIRVITTRRRGLRAAAKRFDAIGVHGEGYPDIGVLALTVAPDADLAAVVNLLDEGRADGSWTYEEGWVTPAWHAAH